MTHAMEPERPEVELPEIVRRYQGAQDRHDVEAALAAFTSDARVVDDGREYKGIDEIRTWLAKTASEFTYTRTFLNASEVGPNAVLVVNRLEGNFPGKVVDLRYQFVLDGGLIATLVIAP